MANYYVDSNTGDHADSGLTQALAWDTIEYAVESGSLVAGDIVWVRRTHAEYSGAPTSNINAAYAGSRSSPISIIGWPRPVITNTVITSASWTNGGTTVDLVVGATLSRGEHLGRYITAPNGKKYLITRIIDSNTLIIDREYSGSTVTLTNGLFQIEADEDYSDRPSDVDGWDSDAVALPVIDFGGTGYYFSASANTGYFFKNLEFRDSTFAVGILYVNNCSILGCLFHTDVDGMLLYANNSFIQRCILEGSATGSSQNGLRGAASIFKDIAIYNMGNYGLYLSSGYLSNVNIGVEQVNAGGDIYIGSIQSLHGTDVKLGSTTKIAHQYTERTFYSFNYTALENYQKVLGDHKIFTGCQELISKDVVVGSGDPYKRSNGADKIIEVDCSISSTQSASIPEKAVLLFTHEFETDTTSKSYRYYVNCKDLSLTASELWLEVEYVDSYDDTSEYTIIREESDEACSLRSGVSDWTQYIEVTGIAPAVASKVRIKCFVAKYDADGYVYIDPLPVVA